MVYNCPNQYPSENEKTYINYFEKYNYELSSFQKFSIESTVKGHHSLVCAHTGSGKTLCAEFAIDYFTEKGKKVIYTSPIKALSNQKFNEFTIKFPNVSVGILTGDIKTNPDAQVLIMTTEILLNKLYQINSKSQVVNSAISFDMDIENELGCVIFDEIHMINDKSRGHVWEQSIMMLPYHIQMVMLSATIDKPHKFASWIESKENNINEIEKKIVYLTFTNERIVPLTHYSFITVNNAIFKLIKDKTLEQEIKNIINKPFEIQSSKGVFNETHYYKMHKMLNLFNDKEVYVKRTHVLNQVTKYLVENNMLPALCFVLSRKQIEICAREITTVLLEDDSKTPYIIRRECEQIIRKLPNYEEYLELPEYIEMVALLEKGIAIHHSGVTAVFRELIEILYSKGYIKLLFGTETFSIGLNMPTKTVIFTDVNKFDGDSMRLLYSHEYTQMAGRAGRRHIDTVGNVIHLNNLFRNIDCTSYKNMMNGRPQTLVSKFKISFNLILNLIDIGNNNFNGFTEKSMIQNDINSELGAITDSLEKLQKEIENMDNVFKHLQTPKQILNEYNELLDIKKLVVNKKKKEVERKIQDIEENHRFLKSDIKIAQEYNIKVVEYKKTKENYELTKKYLNTNVNSIIYFLCHDNVIIKKEENNTIVYELTNKGFIANHLKEVHCLVFACMIEQNVFDECTPKQLVGIFSCFTNINVSDDYKSINPYSHDSKVEKIVKNIADHYEKYSKMEEKYQLNTGTDYNIHYDLIDYAMEWCNCSNISECKLLLQKLELEKGVFLGEFVKALLKINNIVCEMEKIAENTNNLPFLSKLNEIKTLTLKYVVTNQSLYV